MHSQGLIDAQRKAKQAASQLNLKVEIEVEGTMKQEKIDRVRAAAPDLFHSSIASLPDGWTDIMTTFLQDVSDLGEGMLTPAEVRFERSASGVKAFICPNPDMQWTEAKALQLINAQRQLTISSQHTCEDCGADGHLVPLGDRVRFVFCQKHEDRARQKLTEQVQAFDERIRFRSETSFLFQKHSNIWLHVSDHNTPILREALLNIKTIVEERDLIGKIHVTKIIDSEGQLFLSVRYDPLVDVATRLDVDDIVHHAQRLSDEASLKANRGVSCDDA
ncbi:hypothetical protein [Rhizobium sp. AAP43]|uniref:hypothetical protein n=1 Tax=Rhizobium sp. AAP43 TaxID=1523420 RepID=UPI0006B92675|nr:hypothetical protein [Rhizobium sp. AAP43]KPF42999.1 hypothetical protein IP76_14470 [Rhizobium sp. AAP43]